LYSLRADAGLVFVVLRRAGEAGDDVFVGLALGELPEPEGQAARIGGATEVMEVVVGSAEDSSEHTA
jgi:hypothetical protein